MKFRKVISDKGVNRTVANMDGVQSSLYKNAYTIAGKARAELAAHRITGEHTISIDKGAVDRWITLSGPGALSLELGHHNVWSGEWVDGIHVLRKSIRGS